MSVAPETLDTALCEWCTENTEATAKVEYWDDLPLWTVRTYLCSAHCQEVATEFTTVNLYPVTNKPEYNTLESIASPMTTSWTIAELEMAARYGAPYPVCGDLTTKKRIGKSWVGHDPSGEQY